MLDGIADTLLRTLTDQQIYDLIRDHWREIKGLAKEVERRKQKIVSNPNFDPLDSRYRDGRVA